MRAAAVAVAVTLGATAVSVFLGSFVILLVTAIASVTMALSGRALATRLAYTSLGSLTLIGALATARLFGPRTSAWHLALVLALASGVATWQLVRNWAGMARSSAWTWRDLSWGPVAAPLLLLGAVTLTQLIHGSTPAWAMSGDSRNVTLAVRLIADNGGLTDVTYPALFLAAAAYLAVPNGDISEATDLMTWVQVGGQAVIVLLVLVGLVAGLLALGRRTGPAANLVAAAAGAIIVSPMLLGEVLGSGFFSVVVAILGLVACAAPLVDEKATVWEVLGAAALSSYVVGFSYPLAAGVVPALVLPALVWRSRLSVGWRLGLMGGGLVVGGLAYTLMLDRLTTQPQLVSQFVASGGIAGREPALLVVPVVAALLVLLAQRSVAQLAWVASIGAGSMVGLLTSDWLVGLVPAGPTYYQLKTIWVIAAALLPLSLVRVAGRPGMSRRNRDDWLMLPALAAYVFATCVPVLFATVGYGNPLRTMLTGWTLPTTWQAELVEDLGNIHSVSYVWDLADRENDRRLDIWMSAFHFLDDPEYDLNRREATWAYSEDVASPQVMCQIMGEQPQAWVWTADDARADVLIQACPANAARVKVIPRELLPAS